VICTDLAGHLASSIWLFCIVDVPDLAVSGRLVVAELALLLWG
jgi:hypothetical protein